MKKAKLTKWLCALDEMADEWDVFDSMQGAIEKAEEYIIDMSLPKETTIFVCIGRLVSKETCMEFGFDWPYYQIDMGSPMYKITKTQYGQSAAQGGVK